MFIAGLIVCLASVIVNFNTAIYQKGVLKRDRITIFKQYLSSGFFYTDLISIIPFFLSDNYSEAKVLHFIFFLRIRNLMILYDKIEEFLFVD